MLELVWVCKDGRRIPVSKMETSHIRNCLNKIDRAAARGYNWRTEYRARLELELEIRGMK